MKKLNDVVSSKTTKNMSNEIWKTVIVNGVEFPNYEVSSLGRVRSINHTTPSSRGFRTYKGRILKTLDVSIDSEDTRYQQVIISNNKNRKQVYVHRLVAEAFIPKTKEDIKLHRDFIDHINVDKTDNRVENLHWVTVEENQNNPLTKSKLHSSGIHNQNCIIYVYNTKTKKELKCNNMKEVIKHIGNISTTTYIYNCLDGKKTFYKNFMFRYEDTEYPILNSYSFTNSKPIIITDLNNNES